MTNSRRDFLTSVSAAAALGVLHPSAQAACSATQTGTKPLGIAIVGLGDQGLQTLAGDLSESPYGRIAGLVSSDTSRARAYASKHGIPTQHLYSYDSFDKIAKDDSIDLVYVALPNAMHCEFAVRAAQAGKHVFCESPMAINANECRAMIEACARHSRALAVASSTSPAPQPPLSYLGEVQSIEASNSISIQRGNSWRWNRQLAGGGAVMQAGFDVLRTQRLWANAKPTWVIAQETKTDSKRFASLDESVTWSIGFANGAVAHGAVSLNYAGRGQLKITHQFGDHTCEFPSKNHHWTRANQLERFASSILRNSDSRNNQYNPLGADQALEDMVLAEAILSSINQGRQVQLG